MATSNALISSTGTLTVNGAGTVSLGGASTYTGATTISAASTVVTTNATALGNSDVTVNGILSASTSVSAGSLTGPSTASIILGNGAILSTGGKNTALTTFGGVISGGNASSGFAKVGTGIQILGNANTYIGATTVTGGVLSVGTLADGGGVSSIGQADNTAPSLVFNGGTLRYTGAAVSTNRLFTITTGGGALDNSGTGGLNLTNTGSIGFTGTSARTFTLTGTASGANASTLSPILGDNTGVTALTKNGTGTWLLNAVNSFSGAVSVTAGILQANISGSLGSSAATSKFVVMTGGALALASGTSFAQGRSLVLNGSGPAGAGALEILGNSSATFNGSAATPIQILGPTTIGTDAGSFALGNGITGYGNLTVTGAGNTTISGSISTANYGFAANGITGKYYAINPAATNLLDATSASTWLGKTSSPYTPAATSVLTGAINFPLIGTNSFTSSDGRTTVSVGTAPVEARWSGSIFIPNNGLGASTTVPISFEITNDDGAVLYLDGSTTAAVSNNVLSQVVTSKTATVNLTPGAHTIDIEYFNSGGAGSMEALWDPMGGANFVDIPNQTVTTSGGNLSKTGAGTLTLGSANTYTGNTTISAGTVNALASSAFGNSTTSILTVTGAATTVNLWNDPSAVTTIGTADFSAVTGTTAVNTGLGKLAIASQLKLFANTATLTGGTSFSVQGGNIVNDSVTGALARTITVSGGTLTFFDQVTSLVPLVNPSFETDAGAANSWVSQVLTGWTNTGTRGVEQGTSRTWAPTGSTPLNFNGTTNFKWAFLQGPQTMSQSFTGTAGTYTAAFAAVGRAGAFGPLSVAAQFDGVNASSTIVPSQTAWTAYVGTPTVLTSGTHSLAFVFTNPLGGDKSSELDAVSITYTPPNNVNFPNTKIIATAPTTLDLGASTSSHILGRTSTWSAAAPSTSSAEPTSPSPASPAPDRPVPARSRA